MADKVNISESYQKLKDAENGYRDSDKYPRDFQTVDFPELAGKDGKVTTLAHYQAFFFLSRIDPKGKDDETNQQLDTKKLKELFSNIYDYNTNFTMKMDADALRRAPKDFAKKLGAAGDNEPQVRVQVEIIQEFINGGGIRETAKDVLRKKNPKANNAELEVLTNRFLENNFRLEGVETKVKGADDVEINKPLTSAVWKVESRNPDGTTYDTSLIGRQNYYTKDEIGKNIWDGKWKIGDQPKLVKLAAAKDNEVSKEIREGAQEIIDAVEKMDGMKKTIDLTNGIVKTEQTNQYLPPKRSRSAGISV